MIKHGIVFDRDYRIKVLSKNKFGMLAKRIKSGGIRQPNGLFLNPLKVIPHVYFKPWQGGEGTPPFREPAYPGR